MRNYEVAYISDTDLDESAQSDLEKKVTGWITDAGGEIVKIDPWGTRRLAYPIRKKYDGYYVFIQAQLPNDAGVLIERDMQLNEGILRYMITAQQNGEK